MERFALSSIKSKNLDVSTDTGQKWRKGSIFFRLLTLTTNVTSIATALSVIRLLIKVVISLNKTSKLLYNLFLVKSHSQDVHANTGVLSALPNTFHVMLTSVVHCHPKREYTCVLQCFIHRDNCYD